MTRAPTIGAAAARNPPAPDVRRHATVPQSWMQRENWEFETHRSEAVLGCEILNRMTALGRPVSYRIGR